MDLKIEKENNSQIEQREKEENLGNNGMNRESSSPKRLGLREKLAEREGKAAKKAFEGNIFTGLSNQGEFLCFFGFKAL